MYSARTQGKERSNSLKKNEENDKIFIRKWIKGYRLSIQLQDLT